MTDVRFQVRVRKPEVKAFSTNQRCSNLEVSVAYTSRPTILHPFASVAGRSVANALRTDELRVATLVLVVPYCIRAEQTRSKLLITRLARERVLPNKTKTEAAAFLAYQRSPMVLVVLARVKGPVVLVEAFSAPAALKLRI